MPLPTTDLSHAFNGCAHAYEHYAKMDLGPAMEQMQVAMPATKAPTTRTP